MLSNILADTLSAITRKRRFSEAGFLRLNPGISGLPPGSSVPGHFRSIPTSARSGSPFGRYSL